MANETSWRPAGGDLETVLDAHPDPLRALAQAEIPAVVLRQVYDPAHCQRLIERFVEQGLMRDPAITAGEGAKTRIDIGTSLGNRGADKEDFLAHAAATQALFATLFDGYGDPVRTIYDHLQKLAGDKEVKVAREPDGRLYGPAIFRVHYTHHAYRPHIDHVVLREKRFDYAVSRFPHQFAGVLCFQNADDAGSGPQGILHRCLWTEEVQPQIAAGTFHQYAAENGIERCQVELEPGDLYFFNTRLIHEVPAVEGKAPRIVLATFIGYGEDAPEVFVWS